MAQFPEIYKKCDTGYDNLRITLNFKKFVSMLFCVRKELVHLVLWLASYPIVLTVRTLSSYVYVRHTNGYKFTCDFF